VKFNIINNIVNHLNLFEIYKIVESHSMMPLNVVIVEKDGNLKSLRVKDFKLDDLYKKCGFKKSDDFIKQCEWKLRHKNETIYVNCYAKAKGLANSENKYDFPPPIDTVLFFGACALVGYNKEREVIDLTVEMWEKFYEKLFGGFEDLAKTAKLDELEEDELANVPKKMKTKNGYLKDGFVVDDALSSLEHTESNEDDDEEASYEDDDESSTQTENIDDDDSSSEESWETQDDNELAEEAYDYDTENEDVDEHESKSTA
jgi:hypothetical protein